MFNGGGNDGHDGLGESDGPGFYAAEWRLWLNRDRCVPIAATGFVARRRSVVRCAVLAAFAARGEAP